MDDSARAIARDLLAWYRAAGVDDAVQDIPVDWLARGDVAPGRLGAAEQRQPDGGRADSGRAASVAAPTGAGSATPSPAASPPAASRDPVPARTPTAAPRQFATAPPEEAVAMARAAAAQALDIAALGEALAQFDGCGLKATAKNLVFYRGAAQARLMLIGEAPGREEDVEGKPFVGRAGQLLDKMLAATGLSEADCHITNIVYWRPPGNRTPSPIEAQACRPFMERQIELVDPDIVLALGGAAAKALLGVEEGIMRLRGKWREIEIGGRPRRTMATLHPAYLLRTPAQKRLAWRDLLAVAVELDGSGR